MDRVLAIDPSLSSTGYSVITKDTREIITCSRFCTKADINENDRITNIVKHLHNVLYSDESITEIAIEDGFIGASMKTGLQLAKLRGGIITYFKVMNVEVYTQLPTETRKNLGLKGNAKKEEVAAEIVRLYPGIIDMVGPYSDKTNKQKTSDMYDSVCIGISHLNKNRG